ncbi:hypothetical protein C1645_167849 [Glomus cerebriforme]|uniref:Uncharacterized protein n=1 Tax=Glomus cerebriforme TaxID=658196 RepID=A0A397SWN7_9GLOM|nr:hypothetical protein C1645_167849 [Glomus cerebriforme]
MMSKFSYCRHIKVNNILIILYDNISLAYYDIIDLTPATNSDFINSLSQDEYEEMKSLELKLPDINTDEIKKLIVKLAKAPDFRKAVNENFLSTRGDEQKEFLWNFAHLLADSFDRDNDLLNWNLSERMYREVFLAPLIRSLFQRTYKDMDVFL